MLISELFQEQYPTKTLDDLLKDPDVGNFLGYGFYSNVFTDKTNQYNVIKIGEIQEGLGNPEFDAYLNYLAKLKKYKNPVFPQVDSIQIFHDPSSKDHPYIYKVKMERLYPSSDIKNKEFEAFYEKVFGGADIERYKQFDFRTNRPIDFLYAALGDNELFKAIKDPYTRQALGIIKNLNKKGGFNTDLHSGNVMFRRTPYGIQLVVTDPVSGYEGRSKPGRLNYRGQKQPIEKN